MTFKVKSDVDDNLSFEAYRKKFDSVMEFLKEGDCYQINLSKQYKVKVDGDSWQFYKVFRNLNKSRYMAFLDFKDFEILIRLTREIYSGQEMMMLSLDQ